MAGNGRNLRLLPAAIPLQDVVWVRLIQLPWRPDSKDRKPTENERKAS